MPLVAVQLLEHAQDLHAAPGVQVPGRLVGEEELRAVDQRPRDGHALLLAAGELRGFVVHAVAQAHALEHLRRALAPFAFRPGVGRVADRHHHVLQRARPRKQVERLEDEADHAVAQVRALVGGGAGDLVAVQPVLAGGRVVQAAEDVHQGALPRAADAHERDQLAAVNGERDPLQHRQVNLAEVIGLVDVLESEQFHAAILCLTLPPAGDGPLDYLLRGGNCGVNGLVFRGRSLLDDPRRYVAGDDLEAFLDPIAADLGVEAVGHAHLHRDRLHVGAVNHPDPRARPARTGGLGLLAALGGILRRLRLRVGGGGVRLAALAGVGARANGPLCAGVGVQRSAALGTIRTLSFVRPVSNHALAVR